MNYAKLALVILFLGCSSTPKRIQADNPLETYILAKIKTAEGEESYFSLEYLKSEASQYLLSQAKTDLKAGNSVKAVQQLKRARELNPWNDDIKDVFLLSVQALIRTTKDLSNEKCEVLSDRLGLIYSAAPDQISELAAITEKCNFKMNEIDASTFETKPIVDIEKVKGKELETLNDQVNRIIATNGYVPTKELLLTQFNYLSNFSLNLGDIQTGSESTDKDKIRLVIPISSKYEGTIYSEDFCDSLAQMFQNERYAKEALENRQSRLVPGQLDCEYSDKKYSLGRTIGEELVASLLKTGINPIKKQSTISLPAWAQRVGYRWPLPSRFYVKFIFNYMNGTTKIYNNLVQVDPTPYRVETGKNLKFQFVSGELPTELKASSYVLARAQDKFSNDQNFITFYMPSSELLDLKNIDLKIDFKKTFEMYTEQDKQIEKLQSMTPDQIYQMIDRQISPN